MSTTFFLPKLAEWRDRQTEALKHDQQFLKDGLTALSEHLSLVAMAAYEKKDDSEGERLMEQSYTVQRRLEVLQAQMIRAKHLLLAAPEVMGVALVLPMPVELRPTSTDGKGTSGPPMRQDKAVEYAAMKIVMEYEVSQGRRPRDVHRGKSWGRPTTIRR